MGDRKGESTFESLLLFGSGLKAVGCCFGIGTCSSAAVSSLSVGEGCDNKGINAGGAGLGDSEFIEDLSWTGEGARSPLKSVGGGDIVRGENVRFFTTPAIPEEDDDDSTAVPDSADALCWWMGKVGDRRGDRRENCMDATVVAFSGSVALS